MSQGQETFGARGGWWVAAQSVLMLVVVLGGLFSCGYWDGRLGFAVGWLMVLVAGVVGGCGVVHLGAARTAFPKPLEDSVLVTRGIYAWVRHPLYTSVTLFSLGWGLIWASPVAVGGGLVLAVFFDAKARREERWLRERYPGYEEYSRRVRRLVPWVY